MRFVNAIFLRKKVQCDFDYDAMRLPSLLQRYVNSTFKLQKVYSIASDGHDNSNSSDNDNR